MEIIENETVQNRRLMNSQQNFKMKQRKEEKKIYIASLNLSIVSNTLTFRFPEAETRDGGTGKRVFE